MFVLRLRSALSLLALVSLLLALYGLETAYARGGMGGGGGRGSFGGGGFGGRGDYGGAFGSRGDFGDRSDFGGSDLGSRGDFSDFDRGFDRQDFGGMDRSDGFGGVDDRADAGFQRGWGPDGTGVTNWGGSRGGDAASVRQGLATDGGFSNVLTRADAGSLVRPGNWTGMVPHSYLANNGNLVRQSFNRNDLFRADWWAAHHDGWYYPWWGSDWCWGWTGWPALAGLWGVSAAILPTYYDYGDNITYQGDTVYYGDTPTATAADYYQEAQHLASSAAPSVYATTVQTADPKGSSTQRDWKPMGIFSLVQNGQTNSSSVFQLCVNKSGAIGGNYYNLLTDQTQPIKGAVDRKTMRAAFTVGSNKTVVYDTGVSNLMKDQSPILVHFGKDTTQQWMLVRVKDQPTHQKTATS